MSKPDLEKIMKEQQLKLIQSERELEIANVLVHLSTTADPIEHTKALSVLYKSAYTEGYQDSEHKRKEYWRN